MTDSPSGPSPKSAATPDASLDVSLRVADLSARKAHRFALVPDKTECARLAATLDLQGLSKLRFEGTLRAQGKADWVLEARLAATVVQPCTATLQPVTTRLHEDVCRRFSPDAFVLDEDGPTEMEMPEDDTLEPVPEVIDLHHLMTESLVLALPLYPRLADVEQIARTAQPKGVEPISDAALKPFAALSALRNKLVDPNDGESG